ncbi:mitochondrial carrier [Didymella exigua CBS 183.55]|uniref:Mitochondrial carrier n=1 Tax=Didymella exigua CBS 183.55 TaxID=1150837 RepID=A0A6A5RTW4_9PLEO|nr:mitochondrial carrier [Didymella exigua CBS 183.55]KAF1930903.1 mitochondrial carrier [Didymella exigua CBS 183.55]
MSGNTNSDILIAGAIAAFTVDLLVYPLDTLKTRFQSPDYARLYTNQATGKPNPALFRGMYQGIGSVIIATLPSSGAFFTTYERTKTLFADLNSTTSHPDGLLPTPVIHAAASSLAELVSCAILTPAEVIKQNAQMVSSDRSSTNATIQTLRRFQSNPLALWRGYASLAGRNLPFTAMQFPMFERLKMRIRAYRDEKGLTRGTIVESGIITAVSAGSAGAVAAVITTPVDVLKTRIMLSAAEGEGASSKSGKGAANVKNALVDALGESVRKSRSGHKGTWQITQEIVREQGYKGLWRGGALRAVWTFVGAGLYLGAYESGRVYLAARRGEHVDEADLM